MMSQEVTHKGSAMKGVDYTKQLHRDREVFQDTIQKNNKANERRVADVEERANHVMTKQRDNFIEDKADLETGMKKTAAQMDEKFTNALNNKSSDQEKAMQKERENFTRDAISKRKDFDQRLNDITSSYKKSFEDERTTNQEQLRTSKKIYSENLHDVNNGVRKKLSEYQDDMNKSGADLKDQYQRERQQLVRGHEDHLFEMQKEQSKLKMDLKDRIGTDLRKTKEIHQAEAEVLKAYNADRLATLRDTYEDRYQKMGRDYSLRSDKLVDTQQNEALKTNKEHQEHIEDVHRAHNKRFKMVELANRRKDNGSGEFASVMNRQAGKHDQITHEDRVRDLKDQILVAKKTYAEKAHEDQDGFNDTLRKESVDNTARMDRKLSEVHADKITTVSDERDKKVKEIKNREHQNKLDTMAFEQQIKLEQTNAATRLNKLKENFMESMKRMEDSHKVSIDDVKLTSNKDKNDFLKKMQAARAQEIFEMQREFTRMMDATVQDYEARLSSYQRDNEFLKLSMDQKVKNITDQTDKQLDAQRTLFDDRRNADTQNFLTMMDEKEHALKTSMTQLTASFQKKIDKLQIESDTKLKMLTNDYETQLKTLKAMTSKEIASKDMTHQTELLRLKLAYQEDKDRVIANYDAQIQTLKAQQKDQLEQMKSYKEIS